MKPLIEIANERALTILPGDTLDTKTKLVARAMGRGIEEFTLAILHGSDNHKAWLREAADCYCDGKPLPPVKS